jgi:hypothetical protein
MSDDDRVQIVSVEEPIKSWTRPLGRGLEDVSSLFLSMAKPSTLHPPIESPALPQATGGTVGRAAAAVLRPGAALTRDELTAALLDSQEALERGLRMFAVAVPCRPYGDIDLLALDCFDRLTVVEVDTSLGDSSLLRGISHVDWVSRNVATLQRMYSRATIDGSLQPRLVLVVPHLSPTLRSAVRQLASSRVACVRYHTVAMPNGTGILLEPFRDEDD